MFVGGFKKYICLLLFVVKLIFVERQFLIISALNKNLFLTCLNELLVAESSRFSPFSVSPEEKLFLNKETKDFSVIITKKNIVLDNYKSNWNYFVFEHHAVV